MNISAEIEREIDQRIDHANGRYGPPASAHEMLGVIAEEYAELIEAIRAGKIGSVQWEAMDLAAACLRLADTCDRPTTGFAARSGFLDGTIETQRSLL